MKMYRGAATAEKFCYKYRGSVHVRTRTVRESAIELVSCQKRVRMRAAICGVLPLTFEFHSLVR